MASKNQPRQHRATSEFPAGYECDLTCSDVPNDEDEFSKTDHYDDRRHKRSDPNVTDAVIDTLLNDAVVREAYGDWENDRYLFQSEIGDYEWTLVIADDDSIEPRYALITVYSNYHGSVGMTNRYLDRRRKRKQRDQR